MSMRFTLPEQRKLVHECAIPIRWGDMDVMGHVNNTVYFRYFEIVRLEWLYGLGAPCTPQAGQGVVIVNAFCNFLRQIEFPGTLQARLYVAHAGRSSFDTYLTLQRSDEPGLVCAEGGAKTVWTDYVARKSLPLPDWLRQQLG
jgi:acyl-CoA thioester hydrolase